MRNEELKEGVSKCKIKFFELTFCHFLYEQSRFRA